MPDPKAMPRVVQSGPVLSSLFSKAHGLATIDAILTALLCGGASALVVVELWNSPQAINWAVALGVLIALIAYLALAPESVETGCLVSARKRFLDDQITSAECVKARKLCLKKGLWY